jgi:hypothetical protein
MATPRRQSSLRGSPRPAGAVNPLSFQFSPADLRKLDATLSELAPAMRKKVVRGALGKWRKITVSGAKARAPRRTGRLARSIKSKFKTYRDVVWSASGFSVQSRKGLRLDAILRRQEKYGNDYLGAGWRGHFAESGFHPGGRKGKRKDGSPRRSVYVPGRKFLIASLASASASVVPSLREDAAAVLKGLNR